MSNLFAKNLKTGTIRSCISWMREEYISIRDKDEHEEIALDADVELSTLVYRVYQLETAVEFLYDEFVKEMAGDTVEFDEILSKMKSLGYNISDEYYRIREEDEE